MTIEQEDLDVSREWSYSDSSERVEVVDSETGTRDNRRLKNYPCLVADDLGVLNADFALPGITISDTYLK